MKLHSEGGQVTSIRINPFKMVTGNRQPVIADPSDPGQVNGSPWLDESSIHDSRFRIDEKIPWSQYGYYLSQRPSFTFDPLFHAGLYYVQEASSMFLEQALRQVCDLSKPLRILDL